MPQVPEPEIDIPKMWAKQYSDKLGYLTVVAAALAVETNELLTTEKCMECGLRIYDVEFTPSEHWIMWDATRNEFVVVIGCMGYFQIEPNAVGIDNENWSGHPGINV